MRHFDEIFEMAAARHGGAEAFAATLPVPRPAAELAALDDSRWLSQFSLRVFQSGFNWQVVEKKWPSHEAAFHGFDPARLAFIDEMEFADIIKAEGVIRHAKKIQSVRDNAIFFCDLKEEHGSAGKLFAQWPADDFIGLLELMKKRGSRLGGATATYALRFMERDAFILSGDVNRALIREGVIARPASSKGDMKAVQAAFNTWMEQSGRGLSQISRTLACSVESDTQRV